VDDEFRAEMENRSDAELMAIVTTQREEYVESALAAAEAELARRNLTLSQLDDAQEQLKSVDEERKRRANEPLAGGWRLACLLAPGLVTLMLAGKMREGGYDRRSREAWQWTLVGVAIYALPMLQRCVH
jgi:hypothetical protein